MNKQQTKDLCTKFNITKEELIFRGSGIIEWQCEHGVGHPIHVPEELESWGWIHGCDGCCSELFKKEEDEIKSN